jgi:hypothetical protein
LDLVLFKINETKAARRKKSQLKNSVFQRLAAPTALAKPKQLSLWAKGP